MQNDKTVPPAIEQFAEAARRYCSWADGPLGDPLKEMHQARLLLTELHFAAVRLPDLGIGEDVETPDISQDEWSRVCQKFARLPVSSYMDVFNPLKDKEPVTNTLFDDLSDIYRDVKRGLLLFESQHPIDAAWEWRFNFQIHWGQHLVGAQRAIHEYLREDGL